MPQDGAGTFLTLLHLQDEAAKVERGERLPVKDQLL